MPSAKFRDLEYNDKTLGVRGLGSYVQSLASELQYILNNLDDENFTEETIKRFTSSDVGSSYSLTPATVDNLGGIKVGSGLKVELDGTLHAEQTGGIMNLLTPLYGRINENYICDEVE